MKITVTSLNETWVHVDTDPGIAQELWDRLSFDVPGAKFMPAFKRRMWDGKIHLFDKKKNIIHKGLIHYIESYANDNGYKFLKNFSNIAYDDATADEFLSDLKMYSGSEPIELRDYQIEAIRRAITNKRYIALSPTGCLHPNTEIEIELDDVGLKILQDIRSIIS
jgi:hypothetical protein